MIPGLWGTFLVTRLEFLNWLLEVNESSEQRIARHSYESLTDAKRSYQSIR